MNRERHCSSARFVAALYSTAGLVGLISISILLLPSTGLLACAAGHHPSETQPASVSTAEQIRTLREVKSRRGILGILGPTRDGETGTILFGEGDYLVEPTAVRGPR